jgi:hypothetical protein
MIRHIVRGAALACALLFLPCPTPAGPGHPEHPKAESAEGHQDSRIETGREPRPAGRRGPTRGNHGRIVNPLEGSGAPLVRLQPPAGMAGRSGLSPLPGHRQAVRLDPDPTVRYYQQVTDALAWNDRARSQGLGARARAKKVLEDLTMARTLAVVALPPGPRRAEAGRGAADSLSRVGRDLDLWVKRGESQGLAGDALYEWVIRQYAARPLYAAEARGPSAIKPWEMAGGVTPNPSLVKLEIAAQAARFRPLENVTYLWVLGPKGELRVGVETQTPRPTDSSQVGREIEFHERDFAPHEQHYGHPTLVYDLPRHEALYAGELFSKDGQWLINADSGRFGRGRRTAEQGRQLLAQAQMLFKNYARLDVHIGEGLSRDAVTPKTPASELGALLDRAGWN